MRLIDDSPALFITLCFAVLYTVVGIEAAMLFAGSMAFLWLTFALVAAVAAGICAWMFRLLEDGAPVVEAAPKPAEAPAAARPAPQPAARLIHA
jgi:hypothetical protein